MKKMALCLFGLVALQMACTVKTSEETKQETDEIIRNSQQSIEDLLNKNKFGGQPGLITVTGIIVKKEGDKFLLDDRLKVEQFGGKGNKGITTAIVSDKHKAVLSDVVEESSFKGDGTYVNFGCENLDEKETEGLKKEEALLKDLIGKQPSKVFICGELKAEDSTFISVSTEELVLKNARLSMQGFGMGSILIGTQKITLIGENSIQTKGMDVTLIPLPGPEIKLSVTKEIHGEGHLLLESRGGNNVETTKK